MKNKKNYFILILMYNFPFIQSLFRNQSNMFDEIVLWNASNTKFLERNPRVDLFSFQVTLDALVYLKSNFLQIWSKKWSSINLLLLKSEEHSRVKYPSTAAVQCSFKVKSEPWNFASRPSHAPRCFESQYTYLYDV